MSDEQKYNFALLESKLPSIDKKLWLICNFELYKSTLLWTPGMPPIKTFGSIEGSLRERFYSTYRNTLSDFDSENRRLKIH